METIRALRQSDPQALAQVPAVFTRLYSLPIDDRILETASAFLDPLLRTLDAIHLAAAVILGAPKLSFVSYDRRLLAAAEERGLDALAPGA